MTTPPRKPGNRPPPSRDTDGGSKLDVPTGAHRPIGLERAQRRSDAPPRRTRTVPPPVRPDLPTDERPDLPRAVEKQIDRTLGKGTKANDIKLALSIASAAIDDGRPDIAVPMLAWAKHEAPRIATIRETYGVALYLTGDYPAALTELQAYRRITGRTDQNHLIADSLRALGRDIDQIAATAETLINDADAPEDRRTEAVIVYSAALADIGQLAQARAIVRRHLRHHEHDHVGHRHRLHHHAADLAERAGDVQEARDRLQHIATADPTYLDVRQRLEALDEAPR